MWVEEPAVGELLRGPDVNYQHLSLPIHQALQFLKCDRCHVDISLCEVQKKDFSWVLVKDLQENSFVEKLTSSFGSRVVLDSAIW